MRARNQSAGCKTAMVQRKHYESYGDLISPQDNLPRSTVMSYVDRGVYRDFLNKQQSALPDAELVAAALNGSSDAFAELEGLYSQRLYNTIFRITRNREDAEDVLQDTFLHAYLALRSFEGRSSVYSWLTRIAINSALMLLRKRRNHPELCFGLSSEPENYVAHLESQDPCLNPEQVCDQRQRCANIYRAIGRLHVNLREPLQTRMTAGSSLEEMAKKMNITEAAVKSRLFRARTRLNATRTHRENEIKVARPVTLTAQRAGFQN
jgi:RNA polymerase sigma-70 factor (ECF subfamily)